tara:strand:+ start:1601 stop:1732 length:132 start_codon:yes stop_codon:yes gene_type:complete
MEKKKTKSPTKLYDELSDKIKQLEQSIEKIQQGLKTVKSRLGL